MIFITLVTACLLVNFSTCQLSYSHPDYIEPQTQQSDEDEAPVLSFLPPKVAAPRPFFIPELIETLVPPAKDSPIMNFRDFQDVPSEDLVVPNQEKWNAENKPIFFYPVEKITGNVPTTTYPKKYNKNLEKVKPNSLKVKEVMANLEMAVKQRNLDKFIEKLEKQENRKRLEEEAEQRRQQQLENVQQQQQEQEQQAQ